MKKTISIPQIDLSEAIKFILKNLPDPKDPSVSTIKDEVLLHDQKIIYLAQKSLGSEGFCWNINIS